MAGHRTGFMFINANNTWVNACDAEQLEGLTTGLQARRQWRATRPRRTPIPRDHIHRGHDAVAYGLQQHEGRRQASGNGGYL
jgi:hypothetical protein